MVENKKKRLLYLKMVTTCKYFFVKNPILVVHCLNTFGGKWSVNGKPLDLTKYNCKYWITDEIEAPANEFVDKNIFRPVIPKLYRCDAKRLELGFTNVIVKHANSSDVPLEDIVAIAIKAYQILVDKPTITSKTMKELTKVPNLSKIEYFSLSSLSEVFDIDAFYSFMKKNQHTTFSISFNQISEAFKNRLKTIIDEILETKEFSYKPPVINFIGLDFQKYRKLIIRSH
uniref:Uncharacterized protein n=1 Tax=Panagrolaimus davidi TaxID=227884 RepID=A0A914Q0F2_9BILA